MDVQEIIRLANWFDENTGKAISAYIDLAEVLQNNAQQSHQLPIQEPLETLISILNQMPTQRLTQLQHNLLSTINVDHVIGKLGANWIEETVKTHTYDPATAFETVRISLSRLQDAKMQINAFRTAAAEVGFVPNKITENDKEIKISIIFRADVTISNIRDWKTTAADWEKIFHGLAVVVNDKPEDVKVVGFESGSFILTLVATPAITKLLAMISKHITGIAQDIILIKIKLEELKQLKLTTKVMEKEFEMMEKDRNKKGREAIMSELNRQFPDLDHETKNKVGMSIDKVITFAQAGGEIDFSVPDNSSEDENDTPRVEIQEIRELIEEHNKLKQRVKLLINKMKE